MVEYQLKHRRGKSQPVEDGSLGSVEITLSLSSPGPDGEVSWSSSEGSSYDTAEDLANLHLSKQTAQTLASAQPRNRTTTKAKNVQSHPGYSSKVNIAKVEKEDGIGTNAARADKPKSRLLRPFSKTNPPSHATSSGVILGSGITPTTLYQPIKKNKCMLDNVEVFPEIRLASGKEDLSTVCFLSKEETDEVFATRSVPLDITASHFDCADSISAVSTSVNGSIMSLSGLDECDDISQNAFHKMVMNANDDGMVSLTNAPQESLACTSKTHAKPQVLLTDIDSVHSITMVAVSCQRTISSLGSSLTWDSQQDSNNCEGNGSEDAVRGPLKKTNHASQQKERTQPVEASLEKKMSLDVTRGSCMDDRILQLKQRIKIMQKASVLEMDCLPSALNADLESVQEAESVAMDSTVSGLPTEAVTTVADLSANRSARGQRTSTGKPDHPSTYKRNGFFSRSAHSEVCISYDEDGFVSTRGRVLSGRNVPTEIPVNNLEDISLMDCDIEGQPPLSSDFRRVVSTSGYMEGGDSEHLTGIQQNRNDANKQSDLSSLVENFIRNALITMKNFAKYLLVFVQNQRNAFEAKSRSEKAVALFIAFGISLLFMLLIALIA